MTPEEKEYLEDLKGTVDDLEKDIKAYEKDNERLELKLQKLQDDNDALHMQIADFENGSGGSYYTTGKLLEQEILKYNNAAYWLFSPVEVVRKLIAELKELKKVDAR